MTALAGGSLLCEVSSCFQKTRRAHTQNSHSHALRNTHGYGHTLKDKAVEVVFKKKKKKSKSRTGKRQFHAATWRDINLVFSHRCESSSL